MAGRRLLLTGGAGFIGSHLLDALLAAGDQVTVIDNFNSYYDPAIKRSNLSRHLGGSAFELIEGDVCDPTVWESLDPDEGWRGILHIAARAGVRPSIEQPALYWQTNVEGTETALSWACSGHSTIPFLFASSSSVYGDSNIPPYAESAAHPAPVSPYGETKLAAERLLETYRLEHGLPYVVLRFFTVYGPRQRPDLAIHKFARLMDLGEPIPVFGDGSSARDYTHIDDIVIGVQLALERLLEGSLVSSVYNLGSDRSISLDEMIQTIAGAVGRAALIDRLPMQEGDVRRTWADLERSRRELGYEPKMSFADGVADFVRWLRAGGCD
ncbi:MAG: epimerase [Rickettsiales bacterium]|nr:epimerase [Rickettsiales bacterium]|tara:strand:+ start:274 stop:1251 length:978 start_codon:yes stop_codon:yes gene_type:complete